MKNRLVSFINIFGLGLAMSVGMMEMIIVQNELGYDHFPPFPGKDLPGLRARIPKKKRQPMEGGPALLYRCMLQLAADTGVVESAVNYLPGHPMG